MSRGANLSILGLYNADSTVFDLMQFPEDFTEAQKLNTIDNILVECAEFEVLYPNPLVMKNIIGIWSKKEVPFWDRVYKASLLEYNPIENYRRNESETITDGKTEEHSGSDTNTRTGTETNTHEAEHETVTDETNIDTLSGSDVLARTGSDTNTASGSDSTSGSSTSTDTNSGTDTETNSVTGFDSNAFVAHDKSETAHGHVLQNQASGTNTQNYGRVDTQQHNTTDTTRYGKVDSADHDSTVTETHDDTDTLTHNTLETFAHGEKIEHEGNSERNVLAYGNIGVTTSQQMLTEELEVAKIIQVIPIIIESFKNRFCLMVY